MLQDSLLLFPIHHVCYILFIHNLICSPHCQEDSLLSPLYRWRNWGLENLSDLFKVTQVIYGRTGLEFGDPSGIKVQALNHFTLPSLTPEVQTVVALDSSLPFLTASTHSLYQSGARFWPFDLLTPHHPFLPTPTVTDPSAPFATCLLRAFSVSRILHFPICSPKRGQL